MTVRAANWYLGGIVKDFVIGFLKAAIILAIAIEGLLILFSVFTLWHYFISDVLGLQGIARFMADILLVVGVGGGFIEYIHKNTK